VSGPLIPYIKIPEIPLGPLPAPLNSIKPFGILVATGVYVGAMVALKRARQRNLDEAKMNSFILYVVGIGFVGAHVFDAIFYTPDKLMKDPSYLFQFWAGLSSYGGFLGAIIGLVIFKYAKKESVIAYADTVCSAFPISWVFGRAGCASVHDHPGRDTTSWLGVQYYNPRVHDPHAWGFIYDPGQAKGRFDLGFIEFALTIPLAIAFIVLWRRKPRAYGFFPAWMCIFYAPVRFVLDFMRVEPGSMHEADPRYFGLTPAQWACFGLLALGIALLRFSQRLKAPATWEEVYAEGQAHEEERKKLEAEARAERDALRARRRRAAAVEPDEADDASDAEKAEKAEKTEAERAEEADDAEAPAARPARPKKKKRRAAPREAEASAKPTSEEDKADAEHASPPQELGEPAEEKPAG